MLSNKSGRFENLNRVEIILLSIALLAPMLWVAWSRLAWMPGWASVDEAGQIAQLQLWREGSAIPWRLGGGNIHRILMVGWLQLLGWTPANLRSFGLLLFLGENLALCWVAQTLVGTRAAVWAVCVNAFSAVTFTRMGSVLWFQSLPLEWLVVFGSLLHLRRPFTAMLWGIGVGLLLFNYEGWLLAVPGLAVLSWHHLKNTRLRPWASLGFTLGAGLVLFLNRDWFQATATVRLDQTLPSRLSEALNYFFVHLRELVLGGGRALLYLGVPNHPQIAPWAWLGLLGAGPWIKRHWIWVFAVLPPLAALALHAPAIEPNRCLAAWPLFCLTLGIGFARLSDVRPWALGVLFFWALLGVGVEIHAQAEALRQWGPLFYGDSWNQLAAGKFVREEIKSCTLLSDLGPQSGADFRFATGLAPDKLNQGPLVAWIPWQDQPKLDSNLGAWHSFQALPDQGPCLLLAPIPAAGEKLLAVNKTLAPLWILSSTQPANRSIERLEKLTAVAIEDSRLRTALWESRFKMAKYLGRPLADEGVLSLKLKILRADPFIRAARRLPCQDPASLALIKAGCQLDPRRRELWLLYLSRLQCLGRLGERTKLERQLGENPALGQIRSGWLQD